MISRAKIMKLSKLSVALLGVMALGSYANPTTTPTSTPTTGKGTATASKPNSGYNADGTPIDTATPNNRQSPVDNRADNVGISKEQYADFFKANGRPPNVSRMDFTKNSYNNSSWGYGEWRDWTSKGYPRYHYGIDLGNGGKEKNSPMRIGADVRTILQQRGTYAGERTDVPSKDRVAHHHGLVSNPKNTYKRGDIFSLYSNVGVTDYHDHVEYFVLTNDIRMQFRRGIDFQTKGLHYKGMVDYSKERILGSAKYRAIDPTPYLPDLKRSGGNVSFLGNTLYTKYNALYNTKLTPNTNTGEKVVLPSKRIPNIPLTQIAIDPNDLTPDMLMSANMTAVEGANYAEGAGFDYSGEMMTQKMLASSFDDTDGETWHASFGNAPPLNLNEMTQSQLIKHMANRTYNSHEWLSKLAGLSTKGLVMEYLQQQAEINYLMAIYKDLKMQSIQQEALLARLGSVGKDKALDGLADAININYNPNFMDIELGKEGDEWIGQSVPVNGGSGSVGDSTPVDISNLPDDMQGLMQALLKAVRHGEAQTPDGWNNGSCNGKTVETSDLTGRKQRYKQVSQSTIRELMQRYYVHQSDWGKQYGNGVYFSRVTPCDKRIMASGHYQTIPPTLYKLVKKYPQYWDKPYTLEVQELFAVELMMERSVLKSFLKDGRGSVEQAQHALSKIWASIPPPSGYSRAKGLGISNGQTTSYYKGNSASPESARLVRAVLTKIQDYHRNGGSKSTSTTPPDIERERGIQK